MYKFASANIPDVLKIDSVISAFRTTRDNDNDNGDGEVHGFQEFVYVEKGEINMLVDDEIYHLLPGQLILFPPHSFHSIATSHEAVINVVCFSTESTFMQRFKSKVLTLNDRQAEDILHITALGKRIFTTPPRSVYDRGSLPRDDVKDYELQRFANLIEIFLFDLYESSTDATASAVTNSINTANYHSDQLHRLTDFLRANLEHNLTLEEISTALQLSIPNLHRLCKKQCGCGPIAYFIALKISEAKKLMRKTSLNFTQISEQLGFSSVNYFSKLFKKKTGMTPSEYAKSFYRK